MTDIIFCHSGPFFALLPHYGLRKSKFWKYEKHSWTYYHFTNVYHKLQSYDVWFLRYGLQQTGFFVILDHFLPFYPPLTTQKIKILKNWKKATGDTIILHIVYRKWQSYDVWLLRYGAWHTDFFVILDNFLLFYPLKTWKIKISKKWKKQHEISSFYTCLP